MLSAPCPLLTVFQISSNHQRNSLFSRNTSQGKNAHFPTDRSGTQLPRKQVDADRVLGKSWSVKLWTPRKRTNATRYVCKQS